MNSLFFQIVLNVYTLEDTWFTRIKTISLGDRRFPPRHVIISKWKESEFFLFPDSKPAQSLIRAKLEKDPSFDYLFFMKFQAVVFA